MIANNEIKICCQACGENDVAVEQLGADPHLPLSRTCLVICQRCGHSGPIRATRAEAVAAWETENRAAERKLIARIAELDAALAAEKTAHQALRADAQAARAILADIDTGAAADRTRVVLAVGNAFQLLDLALEAGAGESDQSDRSDPSDGEERATC